MAFRFGKRVPAAVSASFGRDESCFAGRSSGRAFARSSALDREAGAQPAMADNFRSDDDEYRPSFDRASSLLQLGTVRYYLR